MKRVGTLLKIMKPWNLFFTTITLLILSTLAMPALLGWQNFNQWAGMYSNWWCYVAVFPQDPATAQGAMQSDTLTAGSEEAARNWGVQQYNQESCAMWAKAQCGTQSPSGFTIAFAKPMLKNREFLGGRNACDLPSTSAFPWFYDAP